MNIVLASSNKGKLSEFKEISKEFPISLVSQEKMRTKYPVLGDAPFIKEEKDSFYENALEKAEAIFNWLKPVNLELSFNERFSVLADDSGLEVFALQNFPGVNSARWAGENVDDRERCELLLQKMKQANLGDSADERRCRFCCSLVCLINEEKSLNEEFFQEGYITSSLQGDGGFGYDPIVFIEELNSTYSELPSAKIKQHGFRAKAARALFTKLGSL